MGLAPFALSVIFRMVVKLTSRKGIAQNKFPIPPEETIKGRFVAIFGNLQEDKEVKSREKTY